LERALKKALADRDEALRDLAAAARWVDRSAFGKEEGFGQAHQSLLKALDKAGQFVWWRGRVKSKRKRRRIQWEPIFRGSERKISTVIIGCEADYRRRKRMSSEDVEKLMQALKEHVNVSYESEASIAAELGVSWDALSGWLRGKTKPTFESLLKLQDFLSRQSQGGGGIVPVGYRPLPGNNPDGRRGKKGRKRGEVRSGLG